LPTSISREFEKDEKKWKQLLLGTYEIEDSNVPVDFMKPVVEACKQKVLDPEVINELHLAMHQKFTYKEFDRARQKLKKDKSPGPSGVTNNQMKSWNESTSRAVFEPSSLMWTYHSVPQF
jgi:hypothetical protein